MSLGSSCAGAVVVVVEVLRFRPDSNPEDEIALLGLTVVVKNCGSGVIIITRIIIMDYYYMDYYYGLLLHGLLLHGLLLPAAAACFP